MGKPAVLLAAKKEEIFMPELASVVESALASYYEEVRERIHELVEPLSTEQLWIKPYSYGNSIGNLLLHVTGNLNHYIGARIAGSGYVRDRNREFTDASKRPKEKVLADFDDAIRMTAATIRKQSAVDLVSEYSADTPSKDRFGVIMRMAAHASHHVGQIIYLREELLKRGA
jgi:uncharacterized damage-inducible protein DinB